MPHLPNVRWDYANQLQYAVCGGYEVYTKTNNGIVESKRETLYVSDGTKRITILDTEKATTGSTGRTTTILPGNGPGTGLGKTTIRYQYDNHLGSASLELDEKAEIISYEEYHLSVDEAFGEVMPFGTQVTAAAELKPRFH